MSFRYKHGGQVSDSIGLLISILVRYPEVATINYDPQSKVLQFTFMLTELLDEPCLKVFTSKFIKCLEIFNRLEDRTPQEINLRYSHFNKMTVIEVKRDVETLTRGEIGLIIDLIREEFKEDLLAENSGDFLEEDLLLQEEIIEHMLESMKGSVPQKKLIAFREEGRVLVFNK